MVIDEGKTYDLAYCVHHSHQRKGYATEMVRGMISHAKAQGARKITIRINKENVPSNKIARKLGFTVTGEHHYKKRGTELEFADFLYERTV